MSAELWNELLQSSLASSLALALILLVRRQLRFRLGANTAYMAWMLVPTVALAVLIPAPAKTLAVLADVPTLLGLQRVGPSPLSAAPGADPRAILLAVWSIGALIALVVFARRQSRFHRLLQRREDSSFDGAGSQGPAVIGLLRPRIVLPADFRERYDADEQMLVLAHEQMHVQRGDIHAQGLATLLRCVFWFNPLIHYAAARFRFDQELACDATVLKRFPNSRRTYGAAMLKTQLADFGLPIGCHWHSIHPLKERIAMLKNPLPGTTRRMSGLILVAALVGSGSYSAWAAQPGASLISVGATTSAASASAPSGATLTTAKEMTPPRYPSDALAKGQGGKVVLLLRVGTDGKVKELKVQSSQPAGVFDQAALAAAAKWQLNPGHDSHGNKIEGWVRVPVTFEPRNHGATKSSG